MRTMKTPSRRIRLVVLEVQLLTWIFVCIVGNSRALAADDAGADTNLDIIQFKAPGGWKAVDRPGQPMKVFAAPDSNAQQQVMIVVMLAPAKEGLDLHSAFGDVAKQMAGSNKIEDTGEPTAGKTRQGFEMMSQKFGVADAAGNRVVVRIVAANVQNRLAAFCCLGGPPAFFDQHQAEMDALLHSVNFNVPTENAPATNTPAAGGTAPAPPAASGDFVAAVHERTAKAMDEAKSDFAKKLEGRRKPHVVLGDVLTLDGKPVPNIVKCQIGVGGTTIAAEHAHYTLEPDEHGHFEQQIPDGLYQMSTKCIVTIAGHHVTADLAPLGKVGHDESSDKGIVQDYRLVMDGLKPDADPNSRNAYYGGQLTVYEANSSTVAAQLNQRFPGSRLQLLFEPQGPLIDGSTGQPFTLETSTNDTVYSQTFQRLPIGPYHVTVRLLTTDGQAKVLNTCQGFGNPYGTTIDVFWQSKRDYDYDRDDPALYVRE
jgi:hypothetical protein